MLPKKILSSARRGQSVIVDSGYGRLFVVEAVADQASDAKILRVLRPQAKAPHQIAPSLMQQIPLAYCVGLA
jgi:hypothetical protein